MKPLKTLRLDLSLSLRDLLQREGPLFLTPALTARAVLSSNSETRSLRRVTDTPGQSADGTQ